MPKRAALTVEPSLTLAPLPPLELHKLSPIVHKTNSGQMHRPMQYGRLFLAGDAAHTVPPTGAKGLNLAIADVHVLDRALGSYFGNRGSELLQEYSATALERVWRVQHFSWWLTSLLHRSPGSSNFDVRRQVAELQMTVSSPSAARLLAENYAGLPLH